MTLKPLRALQGLLLYLPNTWLMDNKELALAGVFSVAVFQPSLRRQDWPYFLFAVGVVLNGIFGVAVTGQFPANLFANNGIEGGLILVLTYLTARSLDDTAWKAVLFFILVEALTIYLQWVMGLRFFFASQQDVLSVTTYEYTREVGDETLWYYIRPQGLSMTSTVAGSKMLLGILIAYMLQMDKRWRLVIIAILTGAIVLNFKRSGFVALGVFAAIVFFADAVENGWHKRHTLAAAATGLVAITYVGIIIAQLTRDQALTFAGLSPEIILTQLSGRTEIWSETLAFIRGHVFFGNFSAHFMVGTGQYVHNSFLSLLATHGLFLAVLLLLYYAGQIRRRPITLILLAPVFIDALAQEDLFWYASLFDIFLLYVLTTRAPSRAWLSPWPADAPQPLPQAHSPAPVPA